MSDTVRHYADEEIDITYDSRRCIHVAECIGEWAAIGAGCICAACRSRTGPV